MSERSIPFSERPLFVPNDPSLLLDSGQLTSLARTYCGQGMFDEAIHVLDMACKLGPSAIIDHELRRARELKRAAEASRFAAIRDEVMEERARDEMDGAQYVGMAQYYIGRDQTPKAIELLEIAKIRAPNNYRPFEVLGRLYFSDGEWELAHAEIQRARQLNPFERSIAELSGRVEFELKNYEKSLRDFIDGFLLTADIKGDENETLRRMINTLKRIVNVDNAGLHTIIRQQLAVLELYAERLEFRKETLFKLESKDVLAEILQKVSRDAEKRENLISFSSELRRLEVLNPLTDEQLLRLSRFARVDAVSSGAFLFREGDHSMDFYVIKSGHFEVRSETPVGSQVFAVLGRDKIVGEMNFLDRTVRSTDARATTTASVYTFGFAALDKATEEDKDLAVGLHWTFWRSLSEKVRDANEQLKLFFPQSAIDGGRAADQAAEGEQLEGKREQKLDLFEERGLSAAEMKLLATFSAEEKFRPNSLIFREGDPGDKLYIVMDGRVLISKPIPGVGDEALAILGRGDFFGEMSLIDRCPRSADARAHERSATVLSINSANLHDVLALDPSASLQFLNLLCRMISRRLREIDQKIVQWKCMSGGF
ncbi:MAG: cyclic nucleotide-binding domain-containing protein [Acidobacteriota bacterium]